MKSSNTPGETDLSAEYIVLHRKASEVGQKHIFRWWEKLDDQGRRKLLDQVRSIDFDLVSCLTSRCLRRISRKFAGSIEPAEVVPVPQTPAHHAARQSMADLGGEVIRRGEVGLFIVAGGQGTRLKYDPPKGAFPLSPITGKCLFHVFAEKLLAASRRYGVAIPLYVMTSTTNNDATQELFRLNQFFGLGKHNVMFVVQDMLPCVTPAGKIILKDKDEIAMNPNGHGGSLKALRDGGALADMRKRGVKYISYQQVDNVLVKSVDPVFVGYHVAANAEMSLKVVRKRNAEEKLGIVGSIGGRTALVEYSDLSPEMMHATHPDGSLKYGVGSIAVHLLNVDFVERETDQGFSLPYHPARKTVSRIGDDGLHAKAEELNGVKFETFVFDALRDARHSVVMEVQREEEFAPLKNASGEDSPATAKQALTNAYGRWLRAAGVHVPTDPDGNVIGAIEISPLFALDAEELAAKIGPHRPVFNGELLLDEGMTAPFPQRVSTPAPPMFRCTPMTLPEVPESEPRVEA